MPARIAQSPLGHPSQINRATAHGRERRLEERLLYVICAVAGTPHQADRALLALRRAAAQVRMGCTLLLFCDLPPASAPREMDDDATVRRLQSGVMSMAARAPKRFLLLVRRRAWDDAARAYLGEGQAQRPEQVVASLILEGRTDAVFEAASFSPSSLQGCFDAALFSSAMLSCTPDTPARMLRSLHGDCAQEPPKLRDTDTPGDSGDSQDDASAAQDNLSLRGCAQPVAVRVLPPLAESESALDRLLRTGFSLSPVEAGIDARLAPLGLRRTAGEPTLYTADALRALLGGEHMLPTKLAADCFFIRQEPATVGGLLSQAQARADRALAEAFALEARAPGSFPARLAIAATLLPAIQMALLLLSGALGIAPLAALAIALPEYPALTHPRLLPGALLRTALLPAHAACVLQALLERMTARSPLLRLRLPDGARGQRGSVVCGAALLLAGFWSVGAAAPLMAVALLWLSAPLLYPALAAPARERIPLSPQEDAQLRALAASAFPASPDALPAPRQMLADCAGCMLGLLEPDEAARRMQALLPRVTQPLSASDQAALLSSAQYLRERMADCDAALRPLPTQIEECALKSGHASGDGLLAALLRAAAHTQQAQNETLAPQTLSSPRAGAEIDPHDALFLPLALLRGAVPEGVSLPLTHPHTFLRRQTLLSRPPRRVARRLTTAVRPERLRRARAAAAQDESEEPDGNDADRFLFLSAASLRHPFAALLLRSHIVAPYAPLLATV